MIELVLGFAVIALAAVLLTRRGREAAIGICAAALGQTAKKNANKEKIIKILSERREAGNAELREALGVTDRSIVRYLDELEKEGRVEQAGKTGRGVTYRLK